ncbi:MAG TPA: hypothetical protein VGI80_01130 [Pyrinomonadaceae bacterium]|jgi:hypothetical protein
MVRRKFFIFAILAALAISASAQTTPVLKFSDLNSYKVENKTFRIAGTVLDIYKCPPCPPHATCKPCFPNHVTIVERIDHAQPNSSVRLRVLTDQIDKFALGNRYLFTVKVYGSVDVGKPITDVTLIRFEAFPLGDPLL